MHVYRDYIFPRLMDWAMRGEAFQRLRADVLHEARGEVLEVGYGTALNLPHYPQNVTTLSMVDPVRILPYRVSERTARAVFPIRIEQAAAESLPFPEHSFDSIVSTWTLCTIRDPVRALQEIGRVLRPTGVFLFLEHGRSEDALTAAWQDRINPVQNLLACGCNLNRPISQLIEQSGLRIGDLSRFQMPRVPRIFGEMYRGRAMPAGLSG
jgi:ubiquinone/menaquinone biosynthesis C-methylase UbiE